MNIYALLGIISLFVFAIFVMQYADVIWDYRNIEDEQALAGQRKRFGISESVQDELIDTYGYPEYIYEIKDKS